MSGWSIPIDRLAEKSKSRLETVVRRVTLEVFTNVVRRSPVKTGRFRANWNVSYGTPDVTVTDSNDRARGRAEAVRARTLPVGGVVYLTNALPYAYRLENGWSRQAPYGMVSVAVAQLNSAVRKAVGP